jgi:hypothetical protein
MANTVGQKGGPGLVTRLYQQICRHSNMLMHYSPDRLCLKCHDCGYETPGWEVTRGKFNRSHTQTHQKGAAQGRARTSLVHEVRAASHTG